MKSIDRDKLLVLQRDVAGVTCVGAPPATLEPEKRSTADPRRFRKARRLLEHERRSLGLQPGVGADDRDLDRARSYRALEQLIARELRQAELRPLAKIGFDGQPPNVRVTPDPRAYTAHPGRPSATEGVPIAKLTVTRNTLSSPLDYLFFQAKAPLEKWEWLAGKRFEFDYHVAHRSGPLTVSLERLVMAKIEPQKRDALQTFKPRRPRRPRRGPPNVSDARLDALARLGRLAAGISKISCYLLEQIVGRERWIKDVAGELRTSPEYVSQRFREALWDAADHYANRERG